MGRPKAPLSGCVGSSRTARTGSTPRAVSNPVGRKTEGVGLEPRRPGAELSDHRKLHPHGQAESPAFGLRGFEQNGPDGINPSGRQQPCGQENGGGGTRTHIRLRAPVFKTGSLANSDTPPGQIRWQKHQPASIRAKIQPADPRRGTGPVSRALWRIHPPSPKGSFGRADGSRSARSDSSTPPGQVDLGRRKCVVGQATREKGSEWLSIPP